jgi:hypothetical protein
MRAIVLKSRLFDKACVCAFNRINEIFVIDSKLLFNPMPHLPALRALQALPRVKRRIPEENHHERS